MKHIFFFLAAIEAIQFVSCNSKTAVTADNTAGFCIPDSLMRNITLDTVRAEYVMSDLKLSGKITFNEDDVVKVFPLVSGHVAEVKVLESAGVSKESSQFCAETRLGRGAVTAVRNTSMTIAALVAKERARHSQVARLPLG